MTTVGSGEYTYELVESWAKLPEGETFGMVSACATDSEGNLYAFQRKEPPIVIFDTEGNYVGSWGLDAISNPHGIFIKDDIVYITDREDSVCLRYTLDGKPLQVIGERASTRIPAARLLVSFALARPAPSTTRRNWCPAPMAICTWPTATGTPGCTALPPMANSSPLGEPGKDCANEFHLVHSMIVGADGLLYVCDRENNRIQIFNADGEYQGMWTDVLRPMDISQDANGVFCISEGGRDARQGWTEDTDSRISLMNQLRAKCWPAG